MISRNYSKIARFSVEAFIPVGTKVSVDMATVEVNHVTGDALPRVPLADSLPVADASDVTAIPGLRELWDVTQGDPSICVAILDGPVDLSHPSLANADLIQLDFANNVLHSSAAPADHGTHVTSIIFGDHDGPVKGIAPRCRGLLIPIFRYAADGALIPCDQKDLARAVEVAVEHGADVINISGGQFSPDGQAVEELARVVESVADRALIVAAAGNDGCECLHVPGALPPVLAVGAMNSQGEPLSFSNWGEAYIENGILAPGENIIGASADGGTTANSGTSFATPIVSGVAALLLSASRQRGQNLTPAALRDCIVQSAMGCDVQPTDDCNRLLGGRLSIPRSLDSLRPQGDSNVNSDNHTAPVSPTSAASCRQPFIAPADATVQAAMPNASPNAAVSQSACGCNGGASQQLVYAIGELGYDFETESRRDSIQHNMDTIQATGRQLAVMDIVDFARHLLGFNEIEVNVNQGHVTDIGGNAGDPMEFVVRGLKPLSNDDVGSLITVSGILIQEGGANEPVTNWPLNNKPLTISHVSNNGRRFRADNSDGDPIKKSSDTDYKTETAGWILPQSENTCKVAKPHDGNRHDAKAVIWTLNRGANLIYAIRPHSSFSHDVFEELVDALLKSGGLTKDFLDFRYYKRGEEVIPWPHPWDPCVNGNRHPQRGKIKLLYDDSFLIERISIPGIAGGQVRTWNGDVATQIDPDLRGMTVWSQDDLIQLILSALPPNVQHKLQNPVKKAALRGKLADIVQRLDEEVRNKGVSPQERALNFATTQLHNILAEPVALDLIVVPGAGDPSKYELADVLVPSKNANCRPESDCWDVEITFFDPLQINAAHIVVRQAIDVSDVVPLCVEPPRRYPRAER